jgi:hypothetical protein
MGIFLRHQNNLAGDVTGRMFVTVLVSNEVEQKVQPNFGIKTNSFFEKCDWKNSTIEHKNIFLLVPNVFGQKNKTALTLTFFLNYPHSLWFTYNSFNTYFNWLHYQMFFSNKISLSVYFNTKHLLVTCRYLFKVFFL